MKNKVNDNFLDVRRESIKRTYVPKCIRDKYRVKIDNKKAVIVIGKRKK